MRFPALSWILVPVSALSVACSKQTVSAPDALGSDVASVEVHVPTEAPDYDNVTVLFKKQTDAEFQRVSWRASDTLRALELKPNETYLFGFELTKDNLIVAATGRAKNCPYTSKKLIRGQNVVQTVGCLVGASATVSTTVVEPSDEVPPGDLSSELVAACLSQGPGAGRAIFTAAMYSYGVRTCEELGKVDLMNTGAQFRFPDSRDGFPFIANDFKPFRFFPLASFSVESTRGGVFLGSTYSPTMRGHIHISTRTIDTFAPMKNATNVLVSYETRTEGEPTAENCPVDGTNVRIREICQKLRPDAVK